MFEFFVTSNFKKALKALDQKTQNSIRTKLEHLSKQENPLLFSKKLKEFKDIFRFRVGNYRIVFRLEKNKIILLLVKHRKDIYEDL